MNTADYTSWHDVPALKHKDQRDQYKRQLEAVHAQLEDAKRQLDQARTRAAALESLHQLAHGQWSALATLPRELRDALGLDPGHIRVEARMRGWRPTVLLELIVDEDDDQPVKAAPGRTFSRPCSCADCVRDGEAL